MVKYKELILKFSYPQLQELCIDKGWEIPSIDELRANKYFLTADTYVWVNETPTDNEDGTRGVLYNKTSNTIKQVNKTWKEHCVIKKETE